MVTKYVIIISMAMTKQFLCIQDDYHTIFGTCKVSYDFASFEQSDWCHHIFGGTNIFLHSFPRLIYTIARAGRYQKNEGTVLI